MNSNNQFIMASGPYFRDVNVNPSPKLTADDARRAAEKDLARYSVQIPSHVMNLLKPGFELLARQAEIVQTLEPKLGIYPTADGYRLVWKVAKFSTNPLTITDELKSRGKISVGPDGTPLGQERVKLRSFDLTNITSGLNGTLTGTHTIVNNALITKAPFAQAAKGTWHFRIDDATNFEARNNEQDQFAQPAEHQDEINAFFFVTYLLEYVDYLHVAGDSVNNRVGQGSFPDDYPNKTIPLPATVHLPNIYMALDIAAGKTPNPTDPDLSQKVLGLDNAFALNLTSLIEGLTGEKSPVVVNPTSYGHGYLLNDLALEATVPYHEGMHAITSPIAGRVERHRQHRSARDGHRQDDDAPYGQPAHQEGHGAGHQVSAVAVEQSKARVGFASHARLRPHARQLKVAHDFPNNLFIEIIRLLSLFVLCPLPLAPHERLR